MFLAMDELEITSKITSYGRILNHKLELKSNMSQILPVNCKVVYTLPQLNLTKLKLEYLKYGCKCKKKERKNTDKIFLHHSSSTFFRIQLKFAFRMQP